MKKTLLALITSLVAGTGISQAQTPLKRYDASYTAGSTYIPLTPLNGGTDIGFTGDWSDTVSSNITLGFPFKYQNTTVHTVAVESFGSLFLNSIASEDIAIGHISGINMAYTGKGRGKVIHSTTGAQGNRIFKIEFQNVGRMLDDLDKDTLNFQIWLYENNNAIEYRAGYSNVPDTMFAFTAMEAFGGDKEPILCGLLSHPGDSIGLNPDNLFVQATRYTTDISVFADTAISFDEIGFDEPLPDPDASEAILYGAFPVSGSVIRFVPAGTTGMHKVAVDMATVYPNPSRDGIYTLTLKEVPEAGAILTMYDITGKAVARQPLHQTSTTLDLKACASGSYFGKIINGSRTGSFKLIRQ